MLPRPARRTGFTRAEVTALLDAGVDGIFADFPDSVVDAREAWLR